MQSNNFLCDFDKVTWYENIPKGSPYEALMEAIFLKDVEAVKAAAGKVPDINHITDFFEDYSLDFRQKYSEYKFCWEQTTPLLFAIRINCLDIVKVLVEDFGADVNFYNLAKGIESPLAKLINGTNYRKPLIEYLISKGADINNIIMTNHPTIIKVQHTGLTLFLAYNLRMLWWHDHIRRLKYIHYLASIGVDFTKSYIKTTEDIHNKSNITSTKPLEILIENTSTYFGKLATELWDALVQHGSEVGELKRPEPREIPEHWSKHYGIYPTEDLSEETDYFLQNYKVFENSVATRLF